MALHFLGYTDTCDSDFAQKNNNKKKNHNYKIIIFSFFFFLMCTSRLLGKQYTCWLSGVPLYEKKQNKKTYTAFVAAIHYNNMFQQIFSQA